MFAVQVTRHAGSAHGHHFETATRLLRQEGEVLTYDEHRDAQVIADFYTRQHKRDAMSICPKIYEVVQV